MALVRWEPVTMNRLFNNLFDTPTGAAAPTRRWVPAMDLAETQDSYVLRADLPGLAPTDVAIELENRVLSISGERTAEELSEGEGYRRVERATGAFRRSLTLPEGVDGEQIAATFDKGVLEVSIPKPAARRPRKLAITVGTPAERVEDAAAEQAATS
jgi:HSP20 family protein